MKTVFFIQVFLVVTNALAQSPQSEINEQVWKPFLKSFNERNTRSFMDVHSKEVIRSPRDSRVVWNWYEYYAQQEKGDKRELASKSRRTLELRFTERIASKDLAIEVGIYKTTYFDSVGTRTNFYGRFHVVLRKEQEAWKILVDTDSSESHSISESDFLAASPMQ